MAKPRRKLALAWRDVRPFSCSVGERKLMKHFVENFFKGKIVGGLLEQPQATDTAV